MEEQKNEKYSSKQNSIYNQLQTSPEKL